MNYYPEGNNKDLQRQFATIEELEQAMQNRDVIESKVLLCDKDHNLHFDLGAARGIIARNDGAIGIETGQVRDIALISKVNKSVCFEVKQINQDASGNYIADLSRKAVQERCINDYISTLRIGDVINARVTHLERFGAFIDIGAGINALVPIDMLSVSRISHPCERLVEGQDIKVILKKIEEQKLTFSLKELLGTWEENASYFQPGETVTGTVRSVENYGIFVELMPNLAGLAEVQDNVEVGCQAAVFVKSIIPSKMKIKLVIVEVFDKADMPDSLTYFYKNDHMDCWNYSPKSCQKQIKTQFTNTDI